MLKNLLAKKDLSQDEIYAFFEWIEKGHLNDAQMAAYLVALYSKGITAEEIGYAYEYLAKDLKPKALPFACLDITGTGGGVYKPLNVSSATSFVVASYEIKVAKQTNSLVTSRCGSKEVLQALGILLPGTVPAFSLLEKYHLAFFSGYTSKAFSLSSPVRKSLRIPTLFEVIHPLLHPREITHQILGVFDPIVMQNLGAALKKLHLPRKIALVFSEQGKDEVSPYGKTQVIEVEQGELRQYEFFPEDLGLTEPFYEQQERSCFSSATHILSILRGEKNPYTAWVLANAAFAFYFLQKTASLKEGKELAEELLQSKKAYQLYEKISQEFSLSLTQ